MAVSGAACSFSVEQWSSKAGPLLSDRLPKLGNILLGSDSLGTAAQVKGTLQGADSFNAEWAALAVNLGMNDAGVYGEFADLGGAIMLDGAYAGSTARELLSLAATHPSDLSLAVAMGEMNQGFDGCQADWYLLDSIDVDGDGVPFDDDCDDANSSIGQLLYSSDLDADSGDFESTEQLGEDWAWDGGSVYATDGGQEVQLGNFTTGTDFPTDYVVYAEVSALGTEPGCGFDCLEVCGDYVPEDDCYTDFQALALGILSLEMTANGTATLTNSAKYDVCLEGFAMWDNPGSQSLVAGSSLDLHYGSWTTDNGNHSPYLDDADFWCYQNGTTLATGTQYRSIGAWLPEDMQYFIAGQTDQDGDGVEDHIDWASNQGVQSQVNLWDYQDSHAVVAVGKLAETTSHGSVEVTLTVQNRGAVPTVVTLTDAIPRAWSLIQCDQTPDSERSDGDTTVLTWDMSLAGCTDDCASVDQVVVTCEISYNLNTDLDIVELPQAFAEYLNVADEEISYSMQAAAFDYDWDSDGGIYCGETERWRAGILARASVDSDQDEGFSAYRCALAENAEEECLDPGYFLQIGEFMDAPENGNSSECEGTCDDASFDQLARADHDGTGSLRDGGSASLTFWVYQDQLYCSAYDNSGELIAETRVADNSFEVGEIGFSTLNMYGDFDSIKVCEVHGAESGS